MRHEKTFRRDDGSRVKVEVRLEIEYGRKPVFTYWAGACQPRKRTFISATNHDDYSWRRLSREDRDKEDMRRILSVATADELHEVAMELWDLCKPEKQST